MSSLLNGIIVSVVLFKKNLGNMEEPIKNATKPMINVMTKLNDGAFSDRSINIENRNITISGLNK